MPRLSAWVQSRLSRRHAREQRTKDRIAFPLPSPPPARGHYVLTPSTSQRALPIPELPSSLFFARLPPEIREEIYLHAFANMIIHVDLQYKRVGPIEGSAPTKGNKSTRGGCIQIEKWCWNALICQRLPMQEYFYDACQLGHNRPHSHLSAGPCSHGCLGIMGWLLSCRQA